MEPGKMACDWKFVIRKA